MHTMHWSWSSDAGWARRRLFFPLLGRLLSGAMGLTGLTGAFGFRHKNAAVDPEASRTIPTNALAPLDQTG